MSEYQYYEFQTIDKPLSEKDKQELRSLSTRAKITSTSFFNEYHWGDFKGNPSKLMEKYFDAFLYFANWGTRTFMLRIPKALVDISLVQQYCMGESASFYEKDNNLIFEFNVEVEDYEELEFELSDFISLRADIIEGDYRCLYLAWLLSVQDQKLSYEDLEPPVPPNLKSLNASLKRFVEFIQLDPDLIEAASECSALEVKELEDDEKLKTWITELSEEEKNEILFRLTAKNEFNLGNILKQRFQKASVKNTMSENIQQSRTVEELTEKAEIINKERKEREAKQKALEKSQKLQKEKEKRENHLANLAKSVTGSWRKVNTLIEEKKAASYEEAVSLIVDLKEVYKRKGTQKEFLSEVQKICDNHNKKKTFLDRLKIAGVTK